jgi:long-chain acyl-CoA synthetase
MRCGRGGTSGLVWFPESWRSPDGTLQRFLPGIGWLLAQIRVPCVPIHIAGSFAALPRGHRWPKPGKIRISVGQPLLPEKLDELLAGPSSPHQRVADALREAVAELSATGPR